MERVSRRNSTVDEEPKGDHMTHEHLYDEPTPEARLAPEVRARLEAEARNHARTGTEAPSMDWPEPREMTGTTADEYRFYVSVYQRELADRWLRETGMIITPDFWHVSATWMIQDNDDLASEAKALLVRPDGTEAPTPARWVELLRSKGEIHKASHVMIGLVDRGHAVYSAELEALTARAIDAERRAEKAERRRFPQLRQGIGFLRATSQRPTSVESARRLVEAKGRELTTRDREARKLFQYQPLGWAERLVVHALAAIAREEGLLDAHPYALQRRPDENTPTMRVRIPFPGLAEVARVARFEADADNRISKETRRTVERALKRLTQETRWIAEPVSVKIGKEWVEDVRVTQTVWVEASTTLFTARTMLDLHPVAFASHLSSYMPADDLAARYSAARKAIGKSRMLDEYAACDDYLRYLYSVSVGSVRGSARKKAKHAGAARLAVVQAGREAASMIVAGDVSLMRKVKDKTLREAIGMQRLARDRGETLARRRVEDSLAFSHAMGTIRSYHLGESVNGEPMWYLELTPLAIQRGSVDPIQGLLLSPEDVI
jgi:hypothetical protein